MKPSPRGHKTEPKDLGYKLPGATEPNITKAFKKSDSFDRVHQLSDQKPENSTTTVLANSKENGEGINSRQ